MEKVTIEIQTINAAFVDGQVPEPEVARMLKEIAEKLECGLYEINYNSGMELRDINGNTVGTIIFE